MVECKKLYDYMIEITSDEFDGKVIIYDMEGDVASSICIEIIPSKGKREMFYVPRTIKQTSEMPGD